MKTIAGPINIVEVNAASFEEATPAMISSALAAHDQVNRCASGTPVINTGEQRFDRRGHPLFTVASLLNECPLHAIPSDDVTDMALDLSERLWVIFDANRLFCLENEAAGAVPDPSSYGWFEFSSLHIPWEANEKLLCVRQIGGSIYVSAENSGVYFLAAAHAIACADLKGI